MVGHEVHRNRNRPPPVEQWEFSAGVGRRVQTCEVIDSSKLLKTSATCGNVKKHLLHMTFSQLKSQWLGACKMAVRRGNLRCRDILSRNGCLAGQTKERGSDGRSVGLRHLVGVIDKPKVSELMIRNGKAVPGSSWSGCIGTAGCVLILDLLEPAKQHEPIQRDPQVFNFGLPPGWSLVCQQKSLDVIMNHTNGAVLMPTQSKSPRMARCPMLHSPRPWPRAQSLCNPMQGLDKHPPSHSRPLAWQGLTSICYVATRRAAAPFPTLHCRSASTVSILTRHV